MPRASGVWGDSQRGAAEAVAVSASSTRSEKVGRDVIVPAPYRRAGGGVTSVCRASLPPIATATVADVPPLLTTTEELMAFVERAKKAGRLAIDTEFVWERTYRPVLGVVQVATDDVALVIDAKAVPSL